MRNCIVAAQAKNGNATFDSVDAATSASSAAPMTMLVRRFTGTAVYQGPALRSMTAGTSGSSMSETTRIADVLEMMPKPRTLVNQNLALGRF